MERRKQTHTQKKETRTFIMSREEHLKYYNILIGTRLYHKIEIAWYVKQ